MNDRLDQMLVIIVSSLSSNLVDIFINGEGAQTDQWK